MTKSDFEKIIEAVEDHFYEEKNASSVKDIYKLTELPKGRVRKLVKKMEGSGLYKIYESKGNPILYITENMKNSLIGQTGEPSWIEKYQFKDKVNTREEISEKQRKLTEYQKLESLLYVGGESLERAVKSVLEILGFEPEKTDDEEDLIIRNNDLIYIIEVKGKTGKIDKSNVAQLGTWLDKWIEREEAEKLRGVLIANHERQKKPDERGEMLTEKAERFLNLRPAFCVSTVKLFELAKKIKKGEMSKKEACKKFLEGDPGP